MKAIPLTLMGACLLPAIGFASAYFDSLEHLAVKDPEFVLFMDMEKDFRSVGTLLTEAYLAYLSTGPEIPPIPVDFNMLFDSLGLSGMTQLVAVSEAHPEIGFTNQLMISFAGPPEGIFLLLGDRNEPFKVAESAPADAQLIAEFNLNGIALFNILRNLVINIMGPMGQGIIDGQMNQPIGGEDGPTLADLVSRLTTKVEMALKSSPDPDGTLPPSLAMFYGESVIRIANIADLMDRFAPMLQQAGFTSSGESGAMTWEMAIPQAPSPLSVYLHTMAGSNDLIVSLGRESKDWFLGEGPRVAGMPEFQQAVKDLPKSGLSFWYSSEEMSRLQIEGLDAQLPAGSKSQPIIVALQRFLLNYTGNQAGVSLLEENAYRVIGLQPTSYKTNIGLMAAIAPIGFASAYAAQQEQAAPSDEEWDSGETDAGDPESVTSPAD